MSDEPIHVRDENGIRIAVLDRPPANAYDESVLLGLRALAEDTATAEGVRGLLITAAGPFFSAGFDLRAPRRDEDATRRMVGAFRASQRALLALQKPTVALVEGHAVAGGLVLALACDHRVFAEGDYKIGLNEVAIGAAYPAAALEIVRLRTSPPVANELLLDAQIFSAADAVWLGLTPRLVPADAAAGEARKLIERLASYPQRVYADTKSRLVADALARIDAISIEAELRIAALWTDDESREARRAQIEKLS
jgi:enoyl-CoA hydratase